MIAHKTAVLQQIRLALYGANGHRQFAHALGVAPRTLARWIAEDWLPEDKRDVLLSILEARENTCRELRHELEVWHA